MNEQESLLAFRVSEGAMFYEEKHKSSRLRVSRTVVLRASRRRGVRAMLCMRRNDELSRYGALR